MIDKRSPNPLNKSKSYVHVPLILLSLVFFLPFLWLVLSSLQPREQIGKNPPEWLPRRHYIDYEGNRVFVTPPQELGINKLEIKYIEGPKKNQKELIDKISYRDGKVKVKTQIADTFVVKQYAADLIAAYPATFVYVKRWQLSKYSSIEEGRDWFCVDPKFVKIEIQAIWGNYSEAIRALTAGDQNKKLPLGELLAKSSTPFDSKESDFKTITFLTYLLNTLVVSVLSVIGTVISSSLVAYGLTRIKWKGRNALFMLTLATMMIPFPVLVIPLYSVFRELGWIGTLMPLWVPTFFGSAFNIFLLRQFFLSLPEELSDAARIDGCSEFGIYWRIILPLSKPALAVVALFQFLFSWNDFLAPMIFLTDPSTFTMALGLQQYQSQSGGSEWHLLMAASVLLVLPIVVLFFFMQKTFIQGISTTGVKG